MLAFENELEQLAVSFYESPTNHNDVNKSIKKMKSKNGFEIHLFNLISNPQINKNHALFYINIIKTELKSDNIKDSQNPISNDSSAYI